MEIPFTEIAAAAAVSNPDRNVILTDDGDEDGQKKAKSKEQMLKDQKEKRDGVYTYCGLKPWGTVPRQLSQGGNK